MRLPGLTAALTATYLLGRQAHGQSVVLSGTSGLTFIQGTQTEGIYEGTAIPTGPYKTYTTKITLGAEGSSNVTTTATGTDSTSHTTTLTGVLTTGTGATVSNGTATSTAPQASNTQKCNNYVDLCKRKYSNITMVGAHNSPFVRPGSAASNQELDVTRQLDDGIRFLQGQMHWPGNDSVPHFCHTSCDLLDAGPITDWLGKVKRWVDKHPYDVVTILLGNGDFSEASSYVPYINSTGLLKYTYSAPYLPMDVGDWPTLESMILRGQRVVMFLDYKADQVKYPWLLDEFSQMWETPFDPQNRDFPCTVQRPPNLSENGTKERLYLMNHNLNAEFNVFGAELLVPAVSLLNETNAAEGYGSLGLAANNCRSDWGRAPNFLNVDYYNYGGFPGSVFEAAARVNNVTYERGHCCGPISAATMDIASRGLGSLVVVVAAMLSAALML